MWSVEPLSSPQAAPPPVVVVQGWAIVVPILPGFKRKQIIPEPTRRLDKPAIVGPTVFAEGWGVQPPSPYRRRYRPGPIRLSVCAGPVLTLVVTVVLSPVPDTTAPGTTVATLQGVWNNGAAFTGSYIFAAPNFAGGSFNGSPLFKIVGNQLQVGDAGLPPGGGLTVIDTVTIEALQ